MIAIVDYGMGNTASVKNALALLGAEARITSRPEDFEQATHIIFPGVGAFQGGMRALQERGLVPVLEREVLGKKKPFLGICLGMQLLMGRGEEGGGAKGLGWIEGTTRRLCVDEKKFRLPHIGWDDISVTNECRLFAGISAPVFYFVHSYVAEPTDANAVVATCTYGEMFTAAVQKGNIYGTQFHPEKSQKEGIAVLKNFINFSHA